MLACSKSFSSCYSLVSPLSLCPSFSFSFFSTSFSATVFTTFGGNIHIRGKQGQPMLNSLVNLVLQVAGGNALPQSPQRLPLELGSAMHDGSFKYDLTSLLRTGVANFTGNAIVNGNELLGPVQGLFQALYYLGKATIHIDEEAPTHLKKLIGCTAGMYSMSLTTPQTPMCAVCPAGTFSAHAAFLCTACADGRCTVD